MHLEIDHEEKVRVLDSFYNKLRMSGHSHNDIRVFFVEGLLRFNSLLDASLLPPDHPRYKPLYLSNSFDKVNRGIDKYLSKYNWYCPGNDPEAHAWKAEIPESLKPPRPTTKGKFKQSSQQIPCSTVLFVPNSNGAALIKRLEQKEPLLTRLTGFKVRLVESSGIPLSRLFSLDLSDGLCHRLDCTVCEKHNGKGSSKCKRKSIVYESRCMSCPSSSNQGVYIGESSRSLYERSLEHLDDAHNLRKCSHIIKHWALNHPSLMTQPNFKFKVLKVHRTPLERQLHEAVKISTDGKLNSKSEFRQNQIKRLAVQLTARELKAVEKELEKEDIETQMAVTSLTCKLNSNKSESLPGHYVNVQPTTSSISDRATDVFFTDFPSKRKDFGVDLSNRSKKFKMGRSSNGNSNNESKNLHKFVPNWNKDDWYKIESLRAPDSHPTSFAEASILAKSWYSKRDSLVNSSNMVQFIDTPVVLGPIQSVQTDSSSGSVCNVIANTPSSTVSQTLSPMSSLGKEQEGFLSVGVLELTINDGPVTQVEDSFDSCPDSSFNKGAIEFQNLVEKAIKRAKESNEAASSVAFEDLVIDMMDLGLNDRLATSSEIPDKLNLKGWNAAQVSQVWLAGPTTIRNKDWNAAVLKKLGGTDLFSRVWESLKVKRKAGHMKRPAACDTHQSSCKKPRSLEYKGTPVKAMSPCIVVPSTIETPINDSNKHSTPAISNHSFVEAIPCNDRIKKRAKRRGILATPRITEWLWSCPLNAHIPMPSPGTPCLPTSDSKNNKKRRRSNKKRKDASRQPAPTFQLDPADTSPIPIPSHEDSSAGRHSIMSPELRSRPTQWNHAASKQTMAADNLSKERSDD